MLNKRWALMPVLVLAVVFVLAACSGTAIETVVVTQLVPGEDGETIVEDGYC